MLLPRHRLHGSRPGLQASSTTGDIAAPYYPGGVVAAVAPTDSSSSSSSPTNYLHLRHPPGILLLQWHLLLLLARLPGRSARVRLPSGVPPSRPAARHSRPLLPSLRRTSSLPGRPARGACVCFPSTAPPSRPTACCPRPPLLLYRARPRFAADQRNGAERGVLLSETRGSQVGAEPNASFSCCGAPRSKPPISTWTTSEEGCREFGAVPASAGGRG